RLGKPAPPYARLETARRLKTCPTLMRGWKPRAVPKHASGRLLVLLDHGAPRYGRVGHLVIRRHIEERRHRLTAADVGEAIGRLAGARIVRLRHHYGLQVG